MSAGLGVGIVMRTKNRAVLLRRAIESVLFQSYQRWELVIVNDGGETAPVDELVAHYADRSGDRIRVVHNRASLGMEGASAVGLGQLDTELIAIHDDDDSWSPEFLTITVAELQRIRRDYPSVQGVTTFCNKVMERIHGQLVHVDSVEAFNEWIPAGFLSLDRMLLANFLPPISFVFTREAFDALDRVYEPIPYLGDWDFMIRFLTKYDIYMIPQYLAFYHWRTRTDSAWMGNSVTGETDRHKFYKQLLLNRWLRADLAAGRFGPGAYANLRNAIDVLSDQNKEQLAELTRLRMAPPQVIVAAPPPEVVVAAPEPATTAAEPAVVEPPPPPPTPPPERHTPWVRRIARGLSTRRRR